MDNADEHLVLDIAMMKESESKDEKKTFKYYKNLTQMSDADNICCYDEGIQASE